LPLLQMDWLSRRLAEVQHMPGLALFMWAGCYILFGIVYWLLTGDLDSSRYRSLKLLGLLVMTLTAMGVGYFSQSGLCALLLVVAAVVLPWLLPLRWAVLGLIVQNLLLIPVFATFPTLGTLALASFQALVYLGFSVLTFVTAVIAKQQAEAREEQRKLNAELRATRALLAESSRIAERMRIARELHDLVGHHLTALSLELEVTRHLVDARASRHVEVAQNTARQLLSDVRTVVSELRQDDAVDLSTALRELAEGIPGLEVKLELPRRFTLDDPRRAEVVLRCVQEIITNVVRHARARRLWLRFELSGHGELLLEARDDGLGSDQVQAGNGLNGMRERLAEFGGRLKITSVADHGFSLNAWLPLGPMETKP
ncbi:MAG: sensor histidine kinase, partial [Rhodanobacteraceae bacterium]